VARTISREKSWQLFEQAQKILVGGVNSPVRAFRAVGGEPLVISRAEGARIWDADGNEYVDFVCSWGAMILGHAHPAVTQAIQSQAARGTSYGMTSELEVELARRIQRALPSLEKIRFVSSGTEATMSAIRAARGFTMRNYIVKFEGCYHGHADSFLSQAGSGLATLGIAASPGVPASLAELTLNIPFNDPEAAELVFAKYPDQIAAVIVEPVAANMGVVPPAPAFLEALRKLTSRHGALLIFDEVISGFRLAYGGAQTLFGIRPDLTTLGKIIGGGLPVGAYGGRADIMERMAPLGPIYQAGTLSGNPLAMAAGIATLDQLQASDFYSNLNAKAEEFFAALRRASDGTGVPVQLNSMGSLATVFFAEARVTDYESAKKADTTLFAACFTQMLNRGYFLPPSQFEALFVSSAHSREDLERAAAAFGESLRTVAARA